MKLSTTTSSRRRGRANAIDGVYGRVVALHEMRDSGEHEPVFLQRALSSKSVADDGNLEMATAATDRDIGALNFLFDGLFNRLRNRALERRMVMRQGILLQR